MRPKGGNQLELSLDRKWEADRNFNQGGRSFYFFDLDDNVIFLSTAIYLFRKLSALKSDGLDEIALSTQEYARNSKIIGKSGPYVDYELRYCESTGSYRRFRDGDLGPQMFLDDLKEALTRADFLWKAPSWNFFHYAVYNSRPISIITARGHAPSTLLSGLDLLVRDGHLPRPPNLLAIFPVSHRDTRAELGDREFKQSIPHLKREAILRSVREAMRIYGENPHHRFGMSDDDPHNLELITDAMHELKHQYPQNSFYVISTHGEEVVKQEVLAKGTKTEHISTGNQMALFELGT